MKTVLYVSNSQLLYAERGARVRAIVDFSRGWNQSVGITGALVFTELHFMQYIEGPTRAIDDLLANLRADRRHSGIDVIEEGQIETRKFKLWSLAYSGPDTFIDEGLIPLLQSQPYLRQRTASKLLETISSMVGRQLR